MPWGKGSGGRCEAEDAMALSTERVLRDNRMWTREVRGVLGPASDCVMTHVTAKQCRSPLEHAELFPDIPGKA